MYKNNWINFEIESTFKIKIINILKINEEFQISWLKELKD